MKRIVLLVAGLCTSMVSALAQSNHNRNFEISRNLEVFADIYKQLDLFYVDSISPDTVIRWGVDAMLQRLDPFTEYYSDTDTKDLRTLTTGQYAGIGSYIRFLKNENATVISEPYEGSPAQLAGVKAGDVVVAIDDTSVKGMTTDKVSKLLRGEAGSTFKLTVHRPGEKKNRVFTIVRQNIQMPQVPYYGEVQPGVGYIFLTGFTSGAAREVRQAAEDLKAKGVKSLVLDLRGNPGGSLTEAVDIVSLFVPKGSKVVYTKGKLAAANRTYYTTTQPIDENIPLAVLVDGGTASSAEIVSGTLQDYDRAVILGQRTFGKGLVQMVRDLPYQGNLKLTTSRYYIPSGRCIQAYDYRHLNADGSVGTVPDSLTHVFKTRAGREVRDGGGIKPDVVLKPDSLPSMVYDLVASEAFFNYVTQFTAEHDTVSAPGTIALTDDEYVRFVNYVEKSGFTYNRRSVEFLKVLKQIAMREGYYEQAQAEFDALSAKFSTDLGGDLMRFRPYIEKYITEEIARRYYYQRGGVMQQLRKDAELDKAVSLMSDVEAYRQLLLPRDEEK